MEAGFFNFKITEIEISKKNMPIKYGYHGKVKSRGKIFHTK